ncbi:MAG: DsbC family protein [Gammaproteobacteria bacterium]|nr:DsbC family protein [Gammaproteobacteria bacterium]
MKKIYLLPLALILLSNLATAGTIPDKVKQSLDTVAPGYDPDSIKLTPLAGLYEFVAHGQVLYISADGRFIVNGNVIDLETKQNLTELTKRTITKKVMDAYDKKKMITFSPVGKPKYIVSVFTDVDCPYCSMMHKEVPKLNEAGVEVRYLMYPRAGAGSATFKKSVSAWCSEDQKKAIGIAKEGGTVVAKNCENPVQEQFDLGRSLGVNGTPTLILENGKVLPGYLPADRLLKVLKEQG